MANATANHRKPPMIAAAVVVGILSLLVVVQNGDAYEFKVGGSGDWSVAATYNQWAERSRFQIGDTLLFKYQGDKDSVLEVSKDDYNNCNTANPIAKHDDGHTVIKLDKSGPHYFISGVADHCKHNEKVMVVVMADRSHKSSPPAPAPAGEESPADNKNPPSSPNDASSIVMSLLCFIGGFACFLSWWVHLIPRLSKCVYNGRLEILPAKDWELESIHSFEILEMIREHLTSVIGWRADFSVTNNWATTKIKRVDLCQIYTASILFGYFLKSATLRHQLEMSLVNPIDDIFLNSGNHLPLPELYKFRRKNLVFGHTHNTVSTSPFDGKKKQEKLSSYLMGFAPDSLATCAEPNSKEALNLIANHSCALFGDVESDEIISTSFATLKRFVLEAIAFGSFLWDTEEYVKTVYNLEENK